MNRNVTSREAAARRGRGLLLLLAAALLAGGLLGSGYLLFRSLALAGDAAGASDVCSAIFGKGCDATLRDRFSKQLGIPVAGWGVLYFGSLLLLLVLGRVLDEGFRRATGAAAALLVLLGGVVSLGLVVSLLAGRFPLCPLCLVVNGLNLLAVVPVVRFSGRPFREVVRDWGRGLRYLAGAAVADPLAARWRVVGFACVGLAFVSIYQWILIEEDRAASRKKQVDPAKVVASYEAAPRVEIPADPEAPALGSPNARVEVLVFSDAFCPHCRVFWAEARHLVEQYGDLVRIVFRHFPLDPPCNPSVPRPLHPHACNAGLALEAARKQEKFWAYHDALLSPDAGGRKDPFLGAAEAAGLDVERFKRDMGDAKLRERLEADVAVGAKLGITATPAIFLDGRHVEDPSAKAVEILLAHLLGPRE
jgi:protein-disulfide isomerase/uncharacterized membrane protein